MRSMTSSQHISFLDNLNLKARNSVESPAYPRVHSSSRSSSRGNMAAVCRD